jgi:hypothetical protein
MKNKLKIIVVLFIGNICFSQSDSTTTFKEKMSSNLKISYNSSLIYPGMRVGFETPIKRIELFKTNNSGNTKHIFKDRFLTANLSFYHHPTFHDNVYLTVGYTMRRTRDKGFFTEFCPEIGYSRTFLDGTTYNVTDDGAVFIKKFAGYNYTLASLGFGLGYDFSKTKTKPFSIFYKLNMITMFPYNSTLYVRPAMEIGVIYKPKNFLSFNTKSNKIYKTKK